MTMNPLMKPTPLMAALALALLTSALPVQAQERASREREALRRVQQALRTAQDEQGALQREKAKLSAEKESLSQDMGKLDGELKRTASKVGAAQAEARAAQARAGQLESDLGTARTELEALRAQNEQQGRQLQESQARVKAVTAMLERSTQTQKLLEARNQQLYKVGVSVVEVYRSRNPASTLARQAAVLGMDEVKLENVAEAWLDRLEEARFKEEEPQQAP
jgi:chromosome segregation ATPase